MQWGKRHGHVVKHTDATDLPVSLKANADRHRVIESVASLGKSSQGWFYRLKMTMTRDADENTLGIRFSDANRNHRDHFPSINKDVRRHYRGRRGLCFPATGARQ